LLVVLFFCRAKLLIYSNAYPDKADPVVSLKLWGGNEKAQFGLLPPAKWKC
jgi:hypothetical protein